MQVVLLMEDIDDLTSLPKNNIQMMIEVEGRLRKQVPPIETFRVTKYLPWEQLYYFNILARNIAGKWYFVEGSDQTISEELGISIGDCLRFSLGIFIARSLRHGELISRIATIEGLTRIWVWGKSNPAIENAAQMLSVPFEIIPARKPWQRGCLGESRVAQQFLSKVKRVMYEWPKLIAGSLSTTPISVFGQSLKIFAPKDVATADFVSRIAERLKATVYWDVPDVRYSAKWMRIQNRDAYRKQLDFILKSDAYMLLVESLPSWFRSALTGWLSKNFPIAAERLLRNAVRFRAFLEEIPVDIALMPMAWGGEMRAYMHVARQFGIPTVVIQDGILAKDYESCVPPVAADYALVLGESGRLWFQDAGIPSSNIFVIGSLLWNPKVTTVDEAGIEERRLDPTERKATVVYIAPRPAVHGAQFSEFEAEEQIELVCRTLANCNELDLVVKLHPRSIQWPGQRWVTRIQSTIRKASGGRATIVDPNMDLFSLLGQADIVVSYLSTSLIQAILVRKPVILCEFSGRRMDIEEKVPIAYSPDNLVRLINEALRNPQRFCDALEPVVRSHVSLLTNIEDVTDFITAINTARRV